MAEANAENSKTPNLQDELKRVQGLEDLTKSSSAIQVDDTTLYIFSRVSQEATSDADLDYVGNAEIRFISERTGTQLLDVLLDVRDGNGGTVDQLRDTLDHALTVFEVVGID